MSWQECVRRWFGGRIATGGILSITDLLDELVKHRIVPSALIGNRYLHYILLTQMTVEILDSVYVPPVVTDGRSFVYHMSSKEMLLDEMKRKNAERIRMLLNETGVDLNHFHRLWDGGLNVPIR